MSTPADKERYLREHGWGWLLEARQFHVDHAQKIHPDLAKLDYWPDIENAIGEHYQAELEKLYELVRSSEESTPSP